MVKPFSLEEHKFTFVLNWKMNKTHDEAIGWVKNNFEELMRLAESVHIIIAPSFTEIQEISTLLKDTSVQVAAQNCAAESLGDFSGEISPISLKQIGATHCFIGHCERRELFFEGFETIKKKFGQLLQYNIIPIMCIGEVEKNDVVIIDERLRMQLHDLKLDIYQQYPIYLVYEPCWAIGVDLQDEDIDYLVSIMTHLNAYCTKNITMLYGGGVHKESMNLLKNKLPFLKGFLLGSVGLDFQMLRDIVLF